MKTIYILRHCKSAWDNPSLSDIERPLNSRGKKDAPLMAEVMKRMDFLPQLVILSPSVRTRLTVAPIIEMFKISKDQIAIESLLYHGGPDDFEQIIQRLDDDIDNALLVGHNPGITYIANKCLGKHIDNVPTGGLLKIYSDVKEWRDFEFSKSKLKKFLYPKMFK